MTCTSLHSCTSHIALLRSKFAWGSPQSLHWTPRYRLSSRTELRNSTSDLVTSAVDWWDTQEGCRKGASHHDIMSFSSASIALPTPLRIRPKQVRHSNLTHRGLSPSHVVIIAGFQTLNAVCKFLTLPMHTVPIKAHGQ